MTYLPQPGGLVQMLSSRNPLPCKNSPSRSIVYCTLEDGRNTTRHSHPEKRRSPKLAPFIVRPEPVVMILLCQLNPQSDAVNHELISHRSCGFVPSTRTCFQNTAQPSMFHRTGCILQLREVITPGACTSM